jgi:hypothetical protein
MNETSSAAMRLPVQGVVYRTRARGAIADGSGVEASVNGADRPFDWGSITTDFMPPVMPPALAQLLSSL